MGILPGIISNVPMALVFVSSRSVNGCNYVYAAIFLILTYRLAQKGFALP